MFNGHRPSKTAERPPKDRARPSKTVERPRKTVKDRYDILLAGDGDPRVFWYEQTTPGAFTQHVLLEGMRQTGGARIDDIDGDGCNDLVVTSYEDNVVYVYGR